jgi:formamidopyrimidine-DNA glycosylase
MGCLPIECLCVRHCSSVEGRLNDPPRSLTHHSAEHLRPPSPCPNSPKSKRESAPLTVICASSPLSLRARRYVAAHCSGKRIRDVTLLAQRCAPSLEGQVDSLVLCDPPDILREALVGRTLVSLGRKGKHLWFSLDRTDAHVMFHLGMTGSFAIRGIKGPTYIRNPVEIAEEWPPRFTKLEVHFDDGTDLAFVNSRRLGRIRLSPDPLSDPSIASLGLDVLSELPRAPELASLLRRHSGALKAVLLDQSVLAGIGNWIADEICFQAKLHPASPSASISDSDAETIHAVISRVVPFACDVGADYAKFPPEWLFHYRWSKGKGPAKTHEGHAISFETVGGRTSAIVSAIQRKLKPASSRGASPAASHAVTGSPPEPSESATATKPRQRAGATVRAPKRSTESSASRSPKDSSESSSKRVRRQSPRQRQ